MFEHSFDPFWFFDADFTDPSSPRLRRDKLTRMVCLPQKPRLRLFEAGTSAFGGVKIRRLTWTRSPKLISRGDRDTFLGFGVTPWDMGTIGLLVPLYIAAGPSLEGTSNFTGSDQSGCPIVKGLGRNQHLDFISRSIPVQSENASTLTSRSLATASTRRGEYFRVLPCCK